MELDLSLEKLKKSKEFKEGISENKNAFFSYAFKMIEDNKDAPWQLGFYNKSTDKVLTFIVDDNFIQMQQEEEIFKKPDMEVKPIEIEKAKLMFEKILKKAEEFQKKKYPKELVSKTIAILQNLEQFGTVWNITFVMHSFRTLNMKINPESGEILHHNLESLMDFVKE